MTFRNWRLMTIVTFLCLICALQARQQRSLGDLGFAMDVIEHSYVEPLNRYELYQAAMDGIVNKLDQYSGYIEPEDFPAFHSQIYQEFGGLGIVIERATQQDPLRIFNVLYDSPAFRAGLLAGDLIEGIDGHATAPLKTEDATRLMRGRPNTEVTLSVRRTTEPKLLSITVRRAIIETESVTGDQRNADGRWNFIMQGDPKLAYVRIEIFGEKTPTEFKHAIESVAGNIDGLVIDLRDNAGGLLPTATELCDMFLDEGDIVLTRGRRPSFSTEHKAQLGTILPNHIPIAVLINGQSASASEVTAACLQDYHRAVVIGQRSFGKGSVQNVIELEGGKAALRVTSAHYFPPSGRNIHKREGKASDSDEWGVHPDEGYEVVLDETQSKAVFERLRNRGNPLTARRDNDASQDLAPQDRDGSLADDPQLLKAIEYLQLRRKQTSTTSEPKVE
jgi:carboxyl-terminal processing protease